MSDFSSQDQELRELLPAYALGDIAEHDRARVDAALAHDASLREELSQLDETMATLVSAVPPERAPAALKGRVLDAVDAATTRRPAPTTAPEITSLQAARAARPARWRRLMMPAVSGIAVAACVALAIVAVDLRSDLDAANDRLDSVGPLAQGSTYRVSTTDGLADARASMVRVGDSYVFAIDDLPDPGEGKSWQLWAAHTDGTVRNLAQWSDGEHRVAVIDGGDDVAEVMISHENVTTPVPIPNGDPVADIKV